MGDQVPEDVKRDRIERLIEVVQQVAHERNQANRAGRGGARRGPSRTDPACSAGARGEHDRELPPARRAGDLVHVEIDSATSTTLKGTQLAAVAA